MFESISNQVVAIFSLSIGGISLGSMIGMLIYCIYLVITNKKNLAVSKKTIEDSFKNVVLPKNIKIDISNKIEKPIREGLEVAGDKIQKVLEQVEQGEKLMLTILALFSHYKKLPEEVQEQIQDFINSQHSMDVSL